MKRIWIKLWRWLKVEPELCRTCGAPLMFEGDVFKGECWRHEFIRKTLEP